MAVAAAGRDDTLRQRLRLWTWIFIVGLVVSGATALPIPSAFDAAASVFGADFAWEGRMPTAAAAWLAIVYRAVSTMSREAPFLSYGTDWLAFGHFMIALVFVGALQDPVRNRWLYRFGMIACVLVLPFALGFGALRGIPFWWRLIDCGFGVLGFVPAFLCHRWAGELEGRP